MRGCQFVTCELWTLEHVAGKERVESGVSVALNGASRYVTRSRARGRGCLLTELNF